jgi:putative glutamine amidotransferase
MLPIVLLTTDRRDGAPPRPGRRIRPRLPEAWIAETYVDAVRGAGGLPVLLPPGPVDVQRLLDRVDAVVLTGGDFDIHPSHYGAQVSARLDRVEPARTALELVLARAALDRGLPLLGICGGMQALAVAAGGTLLQDVATDVPGALEHEQPTDPAEPWHPVRVHAPADRWLGSLVQANSTHHQAVAEPGADLAICGTSDDGVAEVIAGTGAPFVLGVQWHPERLGDLAPYRALIGAATA